MLKPLVQEEGVSVWLYNVSRWQVKGTAPVSTRGHTRAQAHEGIKGKVAVLYAMPSSLVMLPPEKKRKVDMRGSSVSTIKFEPRAVVRDLPLYTRKRKQAGTGTGKKLRRLKKRKQTGGYRLQY